MLESYIAPLFMGYIDKYIQNLKPSDLSLSFWGGDVVLQNLELNLEVLQQELNLPVNFLSGKIYKLQLHVPWTRLIYEPVVVTINTMEFIVTLKDTVDPLKKQNDDVKPEVDEVDQTTLTPPMKEDNLPPGYVQSILNKVINNISLKIDNIIIKYVEDDMVFSVNVKSVDLYSADEDWKRAFTELTLPELLLRKICDVKDLTICLDQQNSSGRIDLYQDPVLYKCNLSCRMSSKYQNLKASRALNTTVNVYCESLDFSLTDQQIPMLMRLLKLVAGLFYGTLDLPGCEFRKHTAPKILKGEKQKQKNSSAIVNTSKDDLEDSWTSWAWSMVPGSAAESYDINNSIEDQMLSFGIYITQLSLTLKKTNQLDDSVISSQRLEFTPLVCFELSGCVVEFSSIGQVLIDVKCGVRNLVGYTMGDVCVCTIPTTQQLQETQEDSFDNTFQTEDEIFLKLGSETRYDPLLFLQRSLFALPDNQSDTINDQGIKIIDASMSSEVEESFDMSNSSFEVPKKLHTGKLESFESLVDDNLLEERYGSVMFNYFYEMELPKVITNEIENIFLFPETDEKVNEVSEKYLYLSSCQLFVTSKFYHAVEWLTNVFMTEIPKRKEKYEIFHDQFSMQQLQLGNFLSRKLELRLSNSKMFICPSSHNKGKFTNMESSNEDKEALMLEIDNLIVQKIDPMYPLELLYLIQQRKLVKLNKIDNMNSKILIEVNGCQGGLSIIKQETMEHQSLVILKPVYCKMNVIVPLLTESNFPSALAITSLDVDCVDVALTFQKSHLMICYYILNTWTNNLTYNNNLCHLYNIFQGSPKAALSPMNVKIKNIESSLYFSRNIWATSGSIGSVMVTLGKKGEDSILIFESPCATNELSDAKSWLQTTETTCSAKFIEYKMQYLNSNGGDQEASQDKVVQLVSVKVSGAALNIDHSLHQWLSTFEIMQSKRSKTRLNSTTPSHRVLNRSVSSTPSRFKSYARIFGGSSHSPSRHSKEKDKTSSPPLPESNEMKTQQRLGEWLIQKINILKVLHIQIDIQPLVVALSKDNHQIGCTISSGIINNIQSKYQQNYLPHTLIICLPFVSMESSQTKADLFTTSLPIFQDNHTVVPTETLPWTISSKDFAILTLVKNSYKDNQLDTLYLCKPVSWNLFVASASPNSKKNASSLEVISEDSVMNEATIEQKFKIKAPFPQLEKITFKIDQKATMGFVLHMHWTTSEWLLCQEQLNLLFCVAKTFISTLQTFTVNKEKIRRINTIYSSNQNTALQSEQLKSSTNDILSISSASTVDQIDALSMLTDSSSIFPKSKVSQDPFISLWIQCTLPKIKFTIFSSLHHDNSFYRMTSEIEEIMFSFDYQNKVLELTNKVAACVVYYSLLRFDKEPNGWAVLDNGYLLSPKESHHDSNHTKTFLSVLYKHTYHHVHTILSPEVTHMEADPSNKSSGTGSQNISHDLQENRFIKQELNINVLSFDLIFNAKPLISSLQIFQNLDLSDLIIPSVSKQKQSKLEILSPPQTTIVPFPLLSVHMESFRIIVPSNEKQKKTDFDFTDNDESVFLLHISSINLTSAPINPLTKTVTEKVIYRQMKQNYRESLRKIKIWNVQYQLDIMNLGICTTNWNALEDSLPDKEMMIQQNPALEWNLRKRYGKPLVTPIFPGFDLKMTIAPPIVVKRKSKISTVTAAAFELHSPRDVKIYINTSQVNLLKQHIEDGQVIFHEFSNIFNSTKKNHTITPTKETNDSGIAVSADSSVQGSFTKLPSVELFASVSNICLFVNHKEHTENFVTLTYPLALINLNQPTLSLSNIKENKVDINLLGLEIHTSSVSKHDTVPYNNDYNICLFTCENGLHNDVTGLLPAFLSASLIMNKDCECFIEMSLNRPMILSYNISVENNILKYYDKIKNSLAVTTNDGGVCTPNIEEGILDDNEVFVEISNAAETKQAKLENTISDEALNNFSFKIKNISISTNRLKFYLACVDSENKEMSTNIQYEKFKSNIALVYKEDDVSKMTYNTDFDVVEVYLKEGEKRLNILSPSKLSIAASTAVFNKGRVLQHAVWFDVGVFQVHISQHILKLLHKFYENVLRQLKSTKNNSNKPSQEQSKEPMEDTNMKVVKDRKLLSSEDDLRNGMFEYIVAKDGTSLPEANQIYFFDEISVDKEVSLMTWRYLQPRKVSKLCVMPLPFHLNHTARKKLAACGNGKIVGHLQYFDSLNQKFITILEFAISENDPCLVEIEDAENHIGCSTLWRVKVKLPENVVSLNENEIDIAILPATSLAASTKVNSIYHDQSSLLDIKLSASKVQCILLNTSNGMESPTFLKPFFVDETSYCTDIMECVNLTFDNIVLKIYFEESAIQQSMLSTHMSMQLMDYNDLCWINFVKPTPVVLTLSTVKPSDLIKYSTKSPSIQLDIGDTEIFITQTCVHTLFMTMQAWNNVISNEPKDLVLFNHYLLCNETQDVIHLQQVNTDEDILLNSGQVYPYSWRTNQHQALKFCIESPGNWKWSNAINLNENGVTLHVLEHKHSVSQVYVEVKTLGGQQKQITFNGCCSFVNKLENDVSIELITQELDTANMMLQNNLIDVSSTFTLPANICRPSHTLSSEFLKTLRVTTTSSLNEETQDERSQFEFHLPHQLNESSHLMKLKNDSLNCWFNLSYNNNLPGQLMLTMQPLMVIRNHMAEAMSITFQSEKEKEEESTVVVEVAAQGKSKQIVTLKTEDTYTLDIALNRGDVKYQSSLPINLKDHKIDYVTKYCLGETWPYERDENKSSVQPVSYTALKSIQKEINALQSEIYIQTSITSLTSPTLNIDIWPSVLFSNETDVDLCLQCDTNEQITALASFEKMSYINVKKSFKFGIQLKTTKCWSNTISLNEDDISTEFLYPGSYLNIILQQTTHKNCYHFTVSCTKVGFITVYTIQKRFQIHNLSSLDIMALPLMVTEKIKYELTGDLSATVISHGQSLPCCRFNTDPIKDGNPTNIMVAFKLKQQQQQQQDNPKDKQEEKHIQHKKLFDDLDADIKKASCDADDHLEDLGIENSLSNIFLNEELSTSFTDELKIDLNDTEVRYNECLCLSEDHFRETITLQDNSNMKNSLKLFAVTTSLDHGIINIFIDEDHSNIVTIENKTNLKLAFQEINSESEKSKHHDIILKNTKHLKVIDINEQRSFQPLSFKQQFPKNNNPIEMNCQFCLHSNQPVELSRPILLKENLRNHKLFIPNCGEIYVSTYLCNAQLSVVITRQCEEHPLKTTKCLALPNFEITVASLNTVLLDYSYPSKIESVFSVTASNLTISHDTMERQISLHENIERSQNETNKQSRFEITIDDFHIDNQINGVEFHFPVIFLPLRQVDDRYHKVTEDVPFINVANEKEEKFIRFIVDVIQNDEQQFVFDNLKVKLFPCEVYLEDTFVYKLVSIFKGYIPYTGTTSTKNINPIDEIKSNAITVLNPLKINNIEIEDLSLLISFHASVKMFIAANHIPLTFAPFKCQPTQTILKEFLRTMLYHYATQALVRTGWILGSLEIIGNPTGLIHNMGRGLQDFVVMPYQGLIRGPSAFVSGINQGASSLIKHMSKGALTSINNVTSSLSRNMDRLCFDELHSLIQEERRANSPTHVTAGFQNAFGSLGLSLLGAVAGIVDHPLQNLSSANTTTEAITGLFTGIAKGVLGVVTKPIGGAMEFVSQASQGILQGSGLVKQPERLYVLTSDNLNVRLKVESKMKIAWQCLQLDYQREAMLITNVKVQTKEDATSSILILTETALFIYNTQKEMITSAFPLNEIQLQNTKENNTVKIELTKIRPQLKKYPSNSLDENPNYRQFFESFRQASVSCQNEVLCENLSVKENGSIVMQMEPYISDLFLAVCQSNKNLILESIPFIEDVDINW